MTDLQFTWYMIVNGFVAIGTIGAVVAALFGKKLFPPKLELTLAQPLGELTKWKQEGLDKGARFYHVRVTNKRRWSPATNLGVHLIAMEEERSDNKFYRDWEGDVQLKWKHTNSIPQPGQVGKPVDYDLVSVNSECFVSLHPIAAATSLNRVRTDRCRFRVWIQARATECDSPVVRIEMSWDGKWSEGNEEMSKHFIISELGKA